ncbi:unnamed protein product [Brassica rapa]|uniref:Complex III subunit VI n=2 Tax=Brassica TaxID=3705 RepID=A0A816PMM9_BRANA|nr:unnamed protein product [Brassica napus]CAG7866959.1 unnamed protein product [Brassica rapa]VDC63918.1 unnamed protein product [Brassica rapa]
MTRAFEYDLLSKCDVSNRKEDSCVLLSHGAEDEVVDPKKYLEESCKPKCVKPLLEYQACVKRIQGDDSGHKHCTGQYFDYWHCIDKCVSICFALHIFFFYFMYTEMKTVILDLQVAPKLFAKLK